MVSNRSNEGNNQERPALAGNLGQDYEKPNSGGGSGPKTFADPSEVREVFFQGIQQLDERIAATAREHRVEATMARVRLRSSAIAKSHRHTMLFDGRKLQVAGVQQPGDILALVTKRSISGLTDLIEHASGTQLAQLSSVAQMAPYDVPIEKGVARSVVTLFDGTLDDGSSLRNQGLVDFQVRGIELQPYGKSTTSYTTSSLPTDVSLQHMPWLRGIRPLMKLRSFARLGPHPIRPMSFQPANRSLPVPIIGVVDSGIDPTITELQRLVVARESHIPPQYADQGHGSLVGALAATGGGFTPNPNHFPPTQARLVDIQVFGTGIYEGVDEDDLLIQIEDAVERYGPQATSPLDEPVVVWNLSIGQDSAASEDLFSLVAMELDRIAQDNKVLFAVAAGNYSTEPLRGWEPGRGPDSITGGEDRISPPADAALSVSVGSLSDTSNPPAASPVEYPSPFSRRGPGPGMLVKPDVVHYGGTCGRYSEPVHGIRGPYRNGTALESIGTSFAAPRVAAQLAQLVGVLPDPEPELLKLLLLLSCTSPGDHDNNNRDTVNYYGFGVPEQPAALLACNPWECTLLLQGELRPGMGITTRFPFPSSLTEQNRRRGFIRLGLVYTPTLDPSKGAEYCQTNVSASFGREFVNPKDGTIRYKREVPPLPQKNGLTNQYEKDLIEHGWKWSPTKVYERTLHTMPVHPNEIGWRLGVNLLLRRELENNQEEVRQPFWLGIRIADPERKSPIYQEIRQDIQAMAMAQPIALRPRIRA